jgi:hypothetical protein
MRLRGSGITSRPSCSFHILTIRASVIRLDVGAAAVDRLFAGVHGLHPPPGRGNPLGTRTVLDAGSLMERL